MGQVFRVEIRGVRLLTILFLLGAFFALAAFAGCSGDECCETAPLTTLELFTAGLPYAVPERPFEEALIECQGGSAPYTWEISEGHLPDWAELQADGSDTAGITGTPQGSDVGITPFTIEVSDGSGQTATRAFALTVAAVLELTTTTMPPGVEGQAYTDGVILTQGGMEPYTWKISAGALPDWAELNTDDSGTASITGTPEPSDAGGTAFTMEVSDGSGQAVNREFTLTVTAMLDMTTTAMPTGFTGHAYAGGTIVCRGGLTPYKWRVSEGRLPRWAGMNAGASNTVLITGTPQDGDVGSTTFTVAVSDASGQSAAVLLTLTVVDELRMITAHLPPAVAEYPYDGGTLSCAGGETPYTWRVSSGALPDWAHLDGNGTITVAITGTPQSSDVGSTTFTVEVSDRLGDSHVQTLVLTVTDELRLLTTSLSTARVGQTYQEGILVSHGGEGLHTWRISSGMLPSWATVSSDGTGTASIIGTPDSSHFGSTTFSVEVSDSLGTTHSQELVLTVTDDLELTTDTLPPAFVDKTYTGGSIQCSGGEAPYTWVISSGTLPAWAQLGSDGGTSAAITGTPQPADVGNTTVTIEVTDNQGDSQSQELVMAVATKLKVVTSVLPYAPIEYPYEEGMLLCAGGQGPYVWTLAKEGLPAWLSFEPDGSDAVFISGTPASEDLGTATITVEVSDQLGQVATQPLELTVTSGVPDVFWTYQAMPNMTNNERSAFATKTEDEWEAYYEQAEEEGQGISDALKAYILDWYYGGADARLPNDLLPAYINSAKTRSWTLQRPDEVDPNEQWFILPAAPVPPDYQSCAPNSAEPNATYLKMPFIAPFDSELLVEGDFPYCRFMAYQILQPFDPQFPATGNMGMPEVPIVEVDIDPDAGHVNPFRIGSDRNAEDRHYHLTFALKMGNAQDLNPVAMVPPHYRAPGNFRVGGPMASTGAYGGGAIVPSILWVRYYAVDHGKDVIGGVPLPKALLRLDSGETFWLRCDHSLAAKRQAATFPVNPTLPENPPAFIGNYLGWLKVFGLFLIHMEAAALETVRPWGHLDPETKKTEIREEVGRLFERGPQFDIPGSLEAGATTNDYLTYLSRPLSLGAGMVYVLTGKIPSTPPTRNGEASMDAAEARYFSICQYVKSSAAGDRGVCVGSLMDDEITTDGDHKYIIVLSRPEERPANAIAENGVTWQNYGPSATCSLTVRWVSVYPDHYLEQYNPHEPNIPWEAGAWSQDGYDETLVGQNSPGVMGPYHPVIHYLSTGEFEALGYSIDPDLVPAWE